MKTFDQSDIDAVIRKAGSIEGMQQSGINASMKSLTDTEDGVAGMLGIPPVVMQVLGGAFSALSIFGAVGANDKVGSWSTRAIKYLAPKRLGITDDKAENIGKKVRTGFLFAAPAIPEILDGIRVGRKHFRQMKALETPIRDLLITNKVAGSGATKITSSSNRILANARAQVNKDTSNGVKEMLFRAVEFLPKMFIAYNQHKINKLNDIKKVMEESEKSSNDVQRYFVAKAEVEKEIKEMQAQSSDAGTIDADFIKGGIERKLSAQEGNASGIDQQIKDLKEKQQKAGQFTLLAIAGGEAGGGMLQQKYEKVEKHTSYDMCLEFEKYLTGALSSISSGGERAQKMVQRDVEKKVAQIFAKVRSEYNMPELTDLMKEKLDEAVKMISTKFVSGELHAKALINLAGETRIMQRQVVANADQVAAELDVQIAKASPQALESTKSYVGRVGFSLKDLVKSYRNLDKQEKLLFGMLMPNSVLKAAGMKRNEIDKVRETTEPEVKNYVACAVLNIAAADTNMLREAGIPDREIAAFREMASNIAEHNDLDTMYFGPDVKDKILQAGMALGNTKEVWQAIFDSGLLAEAQQERQSAAEEEPDKKFTDKVKKKDKKASAAKNYESYADLAEKGSDASTVSF